MNFLSLFAGIGGLDLGLERAGMRCICQVEIDPFCRRVLAKHWPDVFRHDDVRTFSAGMLNEKPELICGGFPCQDISNAGRGEGIDGKRSGLWSEFYRLICEIRPEYVLVENVAALLERGIERVLGDLARCGLDAEWRCYRASQFGAAHLRDRVFILGYRRIGGGTMSPSRNILADAGSESRWIQQSLRPQDTTELLAGCPDVAGTGARGVFDDGAIHTGVGPWQNEPGIGRVGYGLPDWMDRRSRLGNAVVPHISEFIGRRMMDCKVPSKKRANPAEIREGVEK